MVYRIKRKAQNAKRKTIGIIGLGRMGMQIARRLHKKEFSVIAWNRSPKPRHEFKKFALRLRSGSTSGVVDSVAELAEALPKPRIVWLMLPAGELLDKFLFGKEGLVKFLNPRDMVIDGGNSFYRDSIRRAKKLARYQIHFLDCGTSGGIWGERNGFSLMIGGDRMVFRKIKPIFRALAAGNGKNYGLVGPNGAGHFVKMVHNGIEYGMMEAIAEGFAVINKWNPKIDLAEVARIWEKGSVVSSWLINLARDIFEKEDLRKSLGYIHHTGEGEWTIKTAKKLGVDVRVIEDAFKVRLESGQKKNQEKLSNKIVSLLRNRFGGHEVTKRH